MLNNVPMVKDWLDLTSVAEAGLPAWSAVNDTGFGVCGGLDGRVHAAENSANRVKMH